MLLGNPLVATLDYAKVAPREGVAYAQMVVGKLVVERLGKEKAERAQISVPTALLGEADELNLTGLAEPPVECYGKVVDSCIDRLEAERRAVALSYLIERGSRGNAQVFVEIGAVYR